MKELAPHPSNRDGEGLSANRCQTRVKVIKKGGCSKPTLRPNCVAMEDDPDKRHVAKFAMDVIASSPKFARLVEHEIKAGTLGAGHATHGFAMIHDEVPCDAGIAAGEGQLRRAERIRHAGSGLLGHHREAALERDPPLGLRLLPRPFSVIARPRSSVKPNKNIIFC